MSAVRTRRDDRRERVLAALADPRLVAGRLGLDRGAIKQSGGGITVHCVYPAHRGERTPSLSLTIGDSGTLRAVCHGCGERGSVLDLIAPIYGLDIDRDYREVLDAAEALAGLDSGAPVPERRAPPPPREPPPIEEVRALLSEGRAVSEDDEVGPWLRSRGLDPWACRSLCRALISRWPAWARSGDPPRTWSQTGHRLLVPVYACDGTIRSVRARAVRGRAKPKELPPLGHAAASLVFANPAGAELLRGAPRRPAGGPPWVLLAEGTPDYLTWASRLLGTAWAVLGLPGSGAWSAELGARIPDGSLVVIRTDPDDAGDRYAAIAARALAPRCAVRVSDPAGRRRRAELRARSPVGASGEHGPDENELLLAGELPRDPHEGTDLWTHEASAA